MKKRNKTMKLLAGMLALVLSMGCLSGCGQSEQKSSTSSSEQKESSQAESSKEESKAESSAAEEKQETVEIVWYRYMTGASNEDEQQVIDAINEYIEPLIGVTVTALDSRTATKLDLALAAGDEIDLFWTDNGITLARQGAALDITDVIADYPELYNSIPEKFWEAAKIDGKLYCVPNYKEMATGYGLFVPKALADKYNWDISSVKELKDIEPMLEDLKQDGMAFPFLKHGSYVKRFLYDDYAFLNDYLAVEREGDTTKIINIYDTDVYKEHLDLMYSWNQKGYISQEEMTQLQSAVKAEHIKAGRVGFQTWDVIPSVVDGVYVSGGEERYGIDLTGCYVESTSPRKSNYMINANTEKLDAVMKFLTLLNTDQTLADLAVYGIEGEHYTRDSSGDVTKIADSGYNYYAWCVCNVTTPSLLATDPDNYAEMYESFNDNAELACIAGFNFDSTAVSAETSAISAVISEYRRFLEHGFYEADEYLPIFKEKLKDAGIEKVVAEAQSQYDAWLALK